MKYTKATATVVLFNDADAIVTSNPPCLGLANRSSPSGKCDYTPFGLLSEDDE